MKKAAVHQTNIAVVLLILGVRPRRSRRQRFRRLAGSRHVPVPISGKRKSSQLRDLGYVEGKNIAFEYRYAENKLDRFPALADELVRLKVNALLTPGTPGRPSPQKCQQDDPNRFFRRDRSGLRRIGG